MHPEKQSSATLIGVFLLFLVVVASIIAAVVTSNLAQKTAEKASLKEGIVPKVSPASQGESTYQGLPPSFPSDIPIIKKAKITAASESEVAWTVVFSTAMPISQIQGFYEGDLPNAGWNITEQSQAGGLSIIEAAKEGRKAIIAIGKGEVGPTVSITVLKSP